MINMKKVVLLIVVLSFATTIKAQHSVVLKNGKKVNGVVLGIENDVLSVAINRKMVKYPMIQVSSLFFNEYVSYDGKLVEDETNVKTIKSGEYTLKYNIKGRKMLTPPKVSNGTRETGVVVVNIVVNQNGNVISAKSGGDGSTTSSEYLYTKAKFAAQGAKFDPDRKGPVRVEGYIEFKY
jgi:hypothetical protein